MEILFGSAELSPYVRTGGLGDAVAGLAGALASDHQVTVAVPGYADVGVQGRKLPGKPWRRRRDGSVTALFYQDPSFDRPGVYGPEAGSSYPENWARYGRFARAVGELSDGYDVLHLHDGHVGAAALVATTPSVFTIHNAAYPMMAPLGGATSLLGLAGTGTESPLEWYGEANYLKAGLVGADQVTTVSPGHARELLEDATSFGLGGIVRGLARPLVGILNGIDTGSWDPAADPALPEAFDAANLRGRTESRDTLIERAGLDDGFLLANVGRMAAQKGLTLLDYDIDALVAEGFRFVFVGNGELDPMVDDWAERHPAAVAHLPYSEQLARLVFAGTDAYLMPSQFEPCGLGQMYAMRYGAPTIAHFTGGLEDTVVDLDEDESSGNGFVFRSFDHPTLTKTIRRARRYHDALPDLWKRAQHLGMTRDWSWDARAVEYAALYEALVT
jgi:starch synthase